jgi:hypothetical protein
MFVYPAVIREVLKHMIFVEGVDSPGDPSVDWHRDWLEFTKIILPSETHPETLKPQDDNFDREIVLNWIGRMVEEFCYSRNEWTQYILQLKGGEQ